MIIIKFHQFLVFNFNLELDGETSVSVDDLLLPTLDVYVFEEGKTNQFHLPFKPTHPDVQLYLSRRNNKQHWIEV